MGSTRAVHGSSCFPSHKTCPRARDRDSPPKVRTSDRPFSCTYGLPSLCSCRLSNFLLAPLRFHAYRSCNRVLRRLRGQHCSCTPSHLGSVGLVLVQITEARGATVIRTTSTPANAGLARAHDADHVTLYKDEDIAARVLELTAGGAWTPSLMVSAKTRE